MQELKYLISIISKISENNNEESDIIVIPTNHTIEDLIKL